MKRNKIGDTGKISLCEVKVGLELKVSQQVFGIEGFSASFDLERYVLIKVNFMTYHMNILHLCNSDFL